MNAAVDSFVKDALAGKLETETAEGSRGAKRVSSVGKLKTTDVDSLVSAAFVRNVFPFHYPWEAAKADIQASLARAKK